MKKLYEAVPAQEYEPKVGDVIYVISEFEDNISRTERWRVVVVNEKKFAAFLKDKTVYTILREVGSSVSAEDIIEMIDEEISNENALWEKSPSAITSSQHASAVNVLSNLRSRIIDKEKGK